MSTQKPSWTIINQAGPLGFSVSSLPFSVFLFFRALFTVVVGTRNQIIMSIAGVGQNTTPGSSIHHRSSGVSGLWFSGKCPMPKCGRDNAHG